jgi:hypothetical protein
MKKYILYILFLIPLLFLSCDKENEIHTDNGVLDWDGEYEVDGCGFFIIIDDNTYKPVNESIIPDSLKKDELTNIKVEYYIQKDPVELFCYDSPDIILSDAIEIISIEVE